MSERVLAFEPPLEVQVALDLLCARLPPDRPTVVVAGSSGARDLVAARLGETPTPPGATPVQVIWLPERGALAHTTCPAVTPGGAIGAITAGRLAPFLGRLRGRTSLWEDSASVSARLKGHGLTDLESYEIGGATSLIWAGLGRWAERAARPDLADRLLYRYRASLTPGSGGGWSDLRVLVARRP